MANQQKELQTDNFQYSIEQRHHIAIIQRPNTLIRRFYDIEIMRKEDKPLTKRYLLNLENGF